MKQDLEVKRTRIEDNTVVIRKFIKGIEGGRTLVFPDTKTATVENGGNKTTTTEQGVPDTILAGHVVVRLTDGTYQPLAVKTVTVKEQSKADVVTVTYDEKPADSTYAGLLYNYVQKSKPAAAIMTWGIVNSEALPYPVPEEFKTAMPHIDYQIDEEA